MSIVKQNRLFPYQIILTVCILAFLTLSTESAFGTDKKPTGNETATVAAENNIVKDMDDIKTLLREIQNRQKALREQLDNLQGDYSYFKTSFKYQIEKAELDSKTCSEAKASAQDVFDAKEYVMKTYQDVQKTSTDAMAAKNAIDEKVHRIESIQNKVEETASEVDRMKTTLEQVSEKIRAEIDSSSGRAIDIAKIALDVAGNARNKVDEAKDNAMKEVDNAASRAVNLRANELKSELNDKFNNKVEEQKTRMFDQQIDTVKNVIYGGIQMAISHSTSYMMLLTIFLTILGIIVTRYYPKLTKGRKETENDEIRDSEEAANKDAEKTESKK